MDVVEFTEFCILNSEFSKTNPFLCLYNEKLNYENYIEKYIGNLECIFVLCHIQDIISKLVSNRDFFYFVWYKKFPKLPSEILFAQIDFNKIQLVCVAYAILTVKGLVTCITNDVTSSRHDCVFKVYLCEFDSPIRLANCKAHTQYCPQKRYDYCLYQILHS